MENLGPKLHGALLILKKFIVHKCGHEGKPIAASKCFLSMIGAKNEKHYLVATQDRELQKQIRTIAGTPLLYLHSKTPVLEPPSQATIEATNNKLLGITEYEQKTLNDLKDKSGIMNEEEIKPKRKKKKGPNPLSCKKKKKTTVENPIINKKETTTDVNKRKRKKVRIPKHVRDELLKNESTT